MSTVYFIRPVGMEGPVKIGCSAVPADRLATLATWSPFPLEVVATVEGDLDVERRFHGMFAADHSHREWFRPSARLTAVIDRLAAGASLSDVLDSTAKPANFRDYSRRKSPEWRKRMSYAHRLRLAFRGSDNHEPHDVYAIMERWREDVQPTELEIARLDAVLADPSAHWISRKEFWAPAASGEAA